MLAKPMMKPSLVLLFAILFFPALSFGGLETDIPIANRVILPPDAKEPSAEQTQKALAAIQAFLENPGKLNDYQAGAVKRILANTKNYRVQFFGDEVDGKKLIWCNFLPVAVKGGRDSFEFWKQGQVLFSDGGSAFWHITFDPSTGMCSKFQSNGEA